MPIVLSILDQLIQALNGQVSITHFHSGPETGVQTYLLSEVREFNDPHWPGWQGQTTIGLALQLEPEAETVWVFVSSREVAEYLEFPEYRTMRDISNNYILQ